MSKGGGVIKPHLKNNQSRTPCKFFIQGICRKGAACPFSHGNQPQPQYEQYELYEPEQVPQEWEVQHQQPYRPGHMMAGGGGGASSHKYKSTPCKFFAQGMCTRGSSCTFSHGEQEPPPIGARSFGAAGGGGAPHSTPCKFFAMGQCKRGAQCTFSHVGLAAPDFEGGKGGKGGKPGGKPGGKSFGKPFGLPYGGKPEGKPWGGKGWGGKGWGKPEGKPGGKPHGREDSSWHGQGHLLPRTRVTEMAISGTVAEWKGKYGWIEPAEQIDHPKAGKNKGKIWVSMDDIGELSELTPGASVEFHLWEDASGLGAEECLQY
mmetsp:Transcript_79059/g.223741  ORF Transcript_79059/g.223741 Transcript_79059/m.223741 type:complete len:318 (-) Transcript_79059:123-1076(-)|eukprot:CAMPEP_0179267302 /NCGR_PEP_ID=MMETSP0797-20121207/29856_1 /TAXON_ID=47934 /ORGANISM="Dinophysis acuminata, Strain DAEP01" /LENGTH=317 /DNA_ID=CAMNT_0020975551 /DNA_START=36 /DNA_END=989 /DNA_ORIENTATION=-